MFLVSVWEIFRHWLSLLGVFKLLLGLARVRADACLQDGLGFLECCLNHYFRSADAQNKWHCGGYIFALSHPQWQAHSKSSPVLYFDPVISIKDSVEQEQVDQSRERMKNNEKEKENLRFPVSIIY